MSQSQLIADLNRQAAGLLKSHLADLTDAELMTRPVPTANHAMWQLTHLAMFDATLATLVSPSHMVTPPAIIAEGGTKATATSDDPSRFPTKAQVLDLLDKSNAALRAGLPKLSDADLSAPSPEQFRGLAPRLGDLLAMGPMHAMMHLGQIQVLRRALGKPHVF